jgi:hypothetical protein
MIRPTVRAGWESRESAGDGYGISAGRIPVNDDLLMAAFALNEIVHASLVLLG